jgi:hypothetical protein
MDIPLDSRVAGTAMASYDYMRKQGRNTNKKSALLHWVADGAARLSHDARLYQGTVDR